MRLNEGTVDDGLVGNASFCSSEEVSSAIKDDLRQSPNLEEQKRCPEFVCHRADSSADEGGSISCAGAVAVIVTYQQNR